MPYTIVIAQSIQEMVRFFLPRCTDQSTLRELDRMAGDEQQWRYGHALFRRIRDKTIRADQTQDTRLQQQYSFEEFCAKTLYNISSDFDTEYKEFPPPFDAESSFWVLPCAVSFARVLGVDDPCRVSSLLRRGNES